MAVTNYTKQPQSRTSEGVLNQPRIDWPASLEQHRRWLRTVVYARLGDALATDEVWQEIALAVIRSPRQPTDPQKVPPWLYRVAVWQALLYRRAAGRRRKLLQRYAARGGEAPGQAAGNGPEGDPLDWLLAVERRQLVRRALAELKPRDAEILLLKYTEDWTYRHLAEHLGLSESAVEARLHRARGRLRKSLLAREVVEVY